MINSSNNPKGVELEDKLNQVMVVFKYIEDKYIFKKFFSKMLAKHLEENEDLWKMYKLASKIPNGLSELRNLLEAHIENKGLKAIEKCKESAVNDPNIYISAILDVHRKFDSIVINTFNKDSGCVAALDEACRRFINNNAVTQAANSKLSKLLAKFCDLLLKTSSKNP